MVDDLYGLHQQAFLLFGFTLGSRPISDTGRTLREVAHWGQGINYSGSLLARSQFSSGCNPYWRLQLFLGLHNYSLFLSSSGYSLMLLTPLCFSIPYSIKSTHTFVKCPLIILSTLIWMYYLFPARILSYIIISTGRSGPMTQSLKKIRFYDWTVQIWGVHR